MFLKDILAISGHRGLYKFIKQGRNGIIVESLEDKKRMNAYASAKISSLEDITIFSEEDKDISLEDVMKKIFEKEKGGQSIDPKSSDEELKKYFEGIIPDYDKECVYVSDIKKVFSWYNILQKLDMIKIEEEKEPKEEVKEEEEKESKETMKTAVKSEIKKTPKITKVESKPPVSKKPSTKAVATKKVQKKQAK